MGTKGCKKCIPKSLVRPGHGKSEKKETRHTTRCPFWEAGFIQILLSSMRKNVWIFSGSKIIEPFGTAVAEICIKILFTIKCYNFKGSALPVNFFYVIYVWYFLVGGKGGALEIH